MPAPLPPPTFSPISIMTHSWKPPFLKLMQTHNRHLPSSNRQDKDKDHKMQRLLQKTLSERCLGKLLNFDMKTLLKASLWHCHLNKDRPKMTDVSQQSRFLPGRRHAGPTWGFQIFGRHVSAEDLNCDSHSALWPWTKKIQSLFKFKFSQYFINNCRAGLM